MKDTGLSNCIHTERDSYLLVSVKSVNLYVDPAQGTVDLIQSYTLAHSKEYTFMDRE